MTWYNFSISNHPYSPHDHICYSSSAGQTFGTSIPSFHGAHMVLLFSFLFHRFLLLTYLMDSSTSSCSCHILLVTLPQFLLPLLSFFLLLQFQKSLNKYQTDSKFQTPLTCTRFELKASLIDQVNLFKLVQYKYTPKAQYFRVVR